MGHYHYLPFFFLGEFSRYRLVAYFLSFHPIEVFLQDGLQMPRLYHSSFFHLASGEDPSLGLLITCSCQFGHLDHFVECLFDVAYRPTNPLLY